MDIIEIKDISGLPEKKITKKKPPSKIGVIEIDEITAGKEERQFSSGEVAAHFTASIVRELAHSGSIEKICEDKSFVGLLNFIHYFDQRSKELNEYYERQCSISSSDLGNKDHTREFVEPETLVDWYMQAQQNWYCSPENPKSLFNASPRSYNIICEFFGYDILKRDLPPLPESERDGIGLYFRMLRKEALERPRANALTERSDVNALSIRTPGQREDDPRKNHFQSPSNTPPNIIDASPGQQLRIESNARKKTFPRITCKRGPAFK